jgi:phage terminase small subunit
MANTLPAIQKRKHNRMIEKIMPETINKELNDRQKAFVREYCFDWRAGRAYKKVYNVEDDIIASNLASRLLTNERIQRYVTYCRDHVEEMVNVSKAMMLNESMKIALSNIGKYHNNWITLKEFDEISEADKAAIQSIESEVRQERNDGRLIDVKYVKLKLHSKQASIDTINKVLGYNATSKLDVNVTHNDLAEISTDELLKRAKAVRCIKIDL